MRPAVHARGRAGGGLSYAEQAAKSSPFREPGDTTVRRTLELAGDKTPGKIAKSPAKIRAHVPELVAATPAWFPWLTIAGQEPVSDR